MHRRHRLGYRRGARADGVDGAGSGGAGRARCRPAQAVDDGYTMARAAGSARHGSVRVATEEALTWAGACKPGDGLGIAGDEVLIVGEDIVAAGAGLIDLLLVAGGELVTVLTGAGVDPRSDVALQDHVHREHLGAEIVTYHTGHRGDALLIGVE